MSTEIAVLPDALRKLPKESDSAHSSLIHYYQLGPGRSLGKLHQLFMEQSDEGMSVPTRSYGTLASWRSRFQWGERIERVQEDQFAAEIGALHQARIKFVTRQVDMLERWEKMLIMGTPDLDDVSFDKWSKSAKDFISAVGQVFGLQQDTEINVNVKDERGGDSGAEQAVEELMGLIDSARERAELEAFTGDQEIIDVSSEPVRQDSEGERLDSE